MADSPQNTTTVDVAAAGKAGLVTDLNPSVIGKDQYSHARNLVRNSKEGDIGTLGNEPSTVASYRAPYPITGLISLPDDTELVFSTNGTAHEVGIGDRRTDTYTRLSSLPCLNFHPARQITGVAKKHSQKGIVVTFTDKHNPVRRVELDKLPTITECDDLLLWKKISRPRIEVRKGAVGTLPDGAYAVAMAYSVDGKTFSDWYSITNRVLVHSVTGSSSLEVTLSELDPEFTHYQLCVVGHYIDPATKGVTKTAKVIGEFSTRQTQVLVSDFTNPDYQDVKLSQLVIQKDTWLKAGIVASNSNYLLLGDLVRREEENYQLKAMDIEVEYVVDQVPLSYYTEDGRDVGYYRDENYDLYIQGVYTTGELTERFVIPGPKPRPDDLRLIGGADVYELDETLPDCDRPQKVHRFQVENTAGPLIPYNHDFSCNRRTLGHGRMGYHHTSELYPDNPAKFGDSAGTPVRVHRLPSESIVPRYTRIGDQVYANILGLRLKNIPKFDNPDIVGYKVTRSDRKGGNGTVIARGVMTNVRSYTDQQSGQPVLYTNYPLNDLHPDVYLSATQTVYKGGRETNFTPLTDYRRDLFTFHSPHTAFEPRYSLGVELCVESEEVAEVRGRFETVHQHPKLKLLNQFAWWLALAIGIVETYFEAQGLKNGVTLDSSGKVTGTATVTGTSPGTINFGAGTGGLVGGTKTSASTHGTVGGSALSITGTATQAAIKDLLSILSTGNFAQLKTYITVLKDVLKVITSMGVGVMLSVLSVMRYAQEVLDIIDRFTGNTDYVYQYNSVARFVRSLPVEGGNRRRRLRRPAVYVPDTVVTIDGVTYNNLQREKTVLLQLNREVRDPKTTDTSRGTISSFGLCDNPTGEARSTGSLYYVTSKTPNPNQYGQPGSAPVVSLHSQVLTNWTQSPVLWGGDCVIVQDHFLKKMPFFNQTLAGTNYPEGVEYDYRLYRNVAYPRYWLDSSKYDYGELLKKKTINFATFNRTTASRHNLDCKKKSDGDSPTRIDDAYMYTSANCAVEYIVEADFNPAFREKGAQPFFSDQNQNLSDIFRSDRLPLAEEFRISRVYSDLYTTEVYAPSQRHDYDPLRPVPAEQPNAVVYSLPAFNLQKVDNWQYFLPANYFSFAETDFGELTAIHRLDQDRLIFLFSRSSPYVSMGRDFLQLEESGRKLTVGDGGLFAQDPREVLPTDNHYGACSSRHAFSATHAGRFYPSAAQGRFFNFEGMDDVARNGMSHWCKNYMPLFLFQHFPTYPRVERPLGGVGYTTVFDSTYETLYLCKRDYVPRRELRGQISWDNTAEVFRYRGNPVALGDPRYFTDVSWTLSYSVAEKSFVSFHDWHPDLVLQTDTHFVTVKGNTVWKHNEAYNSFCNFYGTDYPFEWEPVFASGQTVETVRSLEYILEVYRYLNFGRDRYHVRDENFSHLLVHNTEQISPLLSLRPAPASPRDRLTYPKLGPNAHTWEVLYEKVENKYRVNQFWDTVKNRNQETHLFPTDESGYRNVVNPAAIDLQKPERERKKFRHYLNKFRFIKDVSADRKFLIKLVDIKKLTSPR